MGHAAGVSKRRFDNDLTPRPTNLPTRRDAIRAGAAVGAIALIGGCDETRAPTPCDVTDDNLLGPFYRLGAPERSNLTEPGMLGTPITISGLVLSSDCAPLAGALVEVWQADWRADETGTYDQVGFRLRGQLVTGADGGYRLETIIPGRYLNGDTYRPAHIHIKVSAPGAVPLTTQLYFEGDPFNDVDPFIEDSLIMALADEPGGGKLAAFDFVLALA